MSRPSIKTALISIFAAIGLMFGGFAWFALSSLTAIEAGSHELAENWLPSVQKAQDIALDYANLRVAYRDHIISTTPEAKVAVEKKIEAETALLQADIEAYLPLITSDHERETIEAAKKATSDLLPLVPVLEELSKKNDVDASTKYLEETMVPVGRRIIDAANDLVKVNKEGGAKSVATSEAVYASTLTMTYVIAAAVGAALLAAIAFVMQGVARPIDAITKSMQVLAAGDTTVEVPFAGRADEVGTMAAAVQVFKDAAISKKRLEDDAVAARQQAEVNRIADQERAEADAAERLATATSGLANGLRRLASGDISFQITEIFAPDFEPLRADFNTSVRQLRETLSAIADSVSSIDNGSNEISNGANDLSKRTEQQAASLEETAAALDQITANVSSSSKRADEARSVATQANSSAAKSGEVVAQAVSAMSRIEDSSKKISNIIGVIDEIAFQTNLLALNAGVEAARAGDAGRGFAVVAQEVRELAQRSASAAKEIKGLIQTSTTEVATGVKLVSETGSALKTIEDYIVSINKHMDAIATSAREQSLGLAEVNTAVNQMDQTTQQNAAMVEETTAASSALANDAATPPLHDCASSNLVLPDTTNPVRALQQTARAMASPARSNTSPSRAPARQMANAGGGAAVASTQEWSEF